jgi:hypothetical protein
LSRTSSEFKLFAMSSSNTHYNDLEPGLSRGTRMTLLKSQPTQEASRMTDQKANVVISYLVAELDRDVWMGAMSAVPIICFCISGMIDAVAFNTWGCFVGMQTGNPATSNARHKPLTNSPHR